MKNLHNRSLYHQSALEILRPTPASPCISILQNKYLILINIYNQNLITLCKAEPLSIIIINKIIIIINYHITNDKYNEKL